MAHRCCHLARTPPAQPAGLRGVPAGAWRCSPARAHTFRAEIRARQRGCTIQQRPRCARARSVGAWEPPTLRKLAEEIGSPRAVRGPLDLAG